jgi:hypothetical protein
VFISKDLQVVCLARLIREVDAIVIQVKDGKGKVVPVLNLGNRKNIFIPFV